MVQTLLNPEVAGVMFTENPVSGADERLIEASWGLGEAVVAGLVVPDHFRLDRRGEVLERKAGRKRIAVRAFQAAGRSSKRSRMRRSRSSASTTPSSRRWANWRFGASRSTGRGATSNGRSRTARCTCSSAARSRRGRNATDAPAGPPPRDPAASLQRVQLFGEMNRKQAEQIARLLKERHYTKGETVIMEGSGGASFFVIESGTVTVTVKGEQRATLGPGDYFGELALIDGGPRSATVTRDGDLVCYGLTFWEFRPLVESNGAIGWKLLQALAKRLRAAEPH